MARISSSSITVFAALAIMLSSCGSSGDPAPAPPPAVDTTKKVFNPKDKLEEIRNRREVVNKDNMTSALRYCETSEYTDIWGTLVRLSKWGKEVHNGDFVILAPTNEKLKEAGLELILELKAAENRELLDRVIAAHIIRTPFSVEKLQEVTELETIDGRKHTVDWGQSKIGSGHYLNTQVYTDRGSVVWMLDVIDLPEKQLRASLERRKSKAQK